MNMNREKERVDNTRMNMRRDTQSEADRKRTRKKGNNAKRRRKKNRCWLYPEHKGIVGPVGYCVVTGVATQALLVDQIAHVKSFDISNSWYQRFVVTIHKHCECGPAEYFYNEKREKEKN